GCGLRNQSGMTPSSATRLRTPLEPMMAVLTAPARIKKPTTQTKALSNKRPSSGLYTFIARSPPALADWSVGVMRRVLERKAKHRGACSVAWGGRACRFNGSRSPARRPGIRLPKGEIIAAWDGFASSRLANHDRRPPRGIGFRFANELPHHPGDIT